MKALRILLGNLDQFRLRFALIFLVGIADGVVTFFIPLALSRFTRGDFATSDFVHLTALLAALFLCSLCLQWVLRRYGELLGPQMGFHLRRRYFKAIESLPASKLAENHSGYLLSLVGAVSDALGGLTIEMFWGVAKSIATIVLFFWATASDSIAVALFNAAVLVVFILVTSKLARQMVPLTNKSAVLRADLFERYADLMSNVTTVKKLGIANFADRQIGSATTDAERGIDKVQRFHAWRWFVLHLLFGCAYIATIAAVLHSIIGNQQAVPILILVVGAYSIVRTLVERLSENYRQLIEIGGYVDTLDSLVQLKPPMREEFKIPDWNEIRLDGVHFSYPGLSQELCYDGLVISKGERIFISGPSGAGKTTLLSLLAGFAVPSKGRQMLGTSDYSTIDDSILRKLFIVCSQETELFNLSIRDNLTLGQTIATEILEDHLGRLGLLDWVKGHADTLDSKVGEKGVKVSAGQKQRLSLIRGVLLARPICLLDEPTAHLDAATEELVAQYLDRELTGRTAVIVSHRTALRRICSRAYYINNGVLSAERI